MTTFRLAGVDVPRIGLGTNRLTTAPEHVAFVREAVAAGVRHIDTAHGYSGGDSERAIGEALGGGGHAGTAVAAQREVGHERDPLALAEVDDVLVSPLGDVVVVLHGGDRHDPAGLLDLLDAHVGEPDVADRAAVDVALDRTQALLERRLRVDAVQVVEADRVGAQRAQALLDLPREHVGPALARPVAALGRDEHVVATARERLADRALALAAAVEVCGVDVPHARGHGLAHEVHVLGRGREAVGAEADPGDVDAGEPEAVHLTEG